MPGRAVTETADDDLIGLIYATALDPALWTDAMAGVADRVGGVRATMTRFDPRTAAGEQFAIRADPAALAQYADYYHATNVFARGDGASRFVRNWRPNVASESEVVAWDDYQSSEFFNDYVRPQAYNAQLFIRLKLEGELATTLSVGRAIDRGRYEATDLEVANRLLPHLVRAYDLGRGLSATVMAGSRSPTATVEMTPDAAFLVDQTCRLRQVNPSGELLLAAGRGLVVHGGRLTAAASDAARRLEQLVGLAARPAGARIGGAMALPQSGARRPLALRVVPFGADAHPVLARPGLALVHVADLERQMRPPETELRELFGLTAAEARLAGAVFEGLGLPEAAEHFGLSVNTLRFQLARVFDKTGVSRQADLVKLMMRLTGGPDGHG